MTAPREPHPGGWWLVALPAHQTTRASASASSVTVGRPYASSHPCAMDCPLPEQRSWPVTREIGTRLRLPGRQPGEGDEPARPNPGEGGQANPGLRAFYHVSPAPRAALQGWRQCRHPFGVNNAQTICRRFFPHRAANIDFIRLIRIRSSVNGDARLTTRPPLESNSPRRVDVQQFETDMMTMLKGRHAHHPDMVQQWRE
jgi:hypothetical protein